ncbi:hypothetical protein L345_06523, partial [Ophiophagus hannah]
MFLASCTGVTTALKKRLIPSFHTYDRCSIPTVKMRRNHICLMTTRFPEQLQRFSLTTVAKEVVKWDRTRITTALLSVAAHQGRLFEMTHNKGSPRATRGSGRWNASLTIRRLPLLLFYVSFSSTFLSVKAFSRELGLRITCRNEFFGLVGLMILWFVFLAVHSILCGLLQHPEFKGLNALPLEGNRWGGEGERKKGMERKGKERRREGGRKEGKYGGRREGKGGRKEGRQEGRVKERRTEGRKGKGKSEGGKKESGKEGRKVG